jgi:hypothetical protein
VPDCLDLAVHHELGCVANHNSTWPRGALPGDSQAHRSWLEFCLAYVDSKWPSAEPKSQDSMTDALATIVPAVVNEDPPDWLEADQLRGALRHYVLDPPSRNKQVALRESP